MASFDRGRATFRLAKGTPVRWSGRGEEARAEPAPGGRVVERHPAMARYGESGGAALALALAVLGAALMFSQTVRADDDAGGGFPCAAYEWVGATWRPPQAAQCHSCYACLVGQVCRRRGGCFNCTAGEYDADGDPTHPCVPCPAGTSSLAGASGEEGCYAVEQSWSDWLHDSLEPIGAALGGLGAMCAALCAWYTDKAAGNEPRDGQDDVEKQQLVDSNDPASDAADGVQREYQKTKTKDDYTAVAGDDGAMEKVRHSLSLHLT